MSIAIWGGQSWEDCGSPDACNSVASLAVYNGELYAGVTRYRAEGSSLPPRKTKTPAERYTAMRAGRSGSIADGCPMRTP